MEDERCCTGMCCVLTFLVGAVLGGGIALLLAPQSGEKTRRQLKRMAEDAKETVEDCYDEMKERATEVTEKVHDGYREAKRTAKSTVDAARNT